MSQVLITKKPQLPIINIAKNGGGNYVFNHYLATYDFRLRFLECKPPADSKGGNFKLTLVSSNATNVNANTLLSNIANGNEIVVYVGKSDATKLLVFRGIIESIEINEPNMNLMEITLTGPDFGSNILKHRVIQGYWEQYKTGDGITLDTTDTHTTPTQIAQDMLNISGNYPTSDGVTAATQGIVVTASNMVALNNTPLAQFTVLLEILDDKISEIDAIAQTTHYVDANKNFIMKPPTLSTTGLPADHLLVDDYSDTVALTWDATKVGLISPGMKLKKTVENYKHRIFGVGGDTISLDQVFETNTTSQDINAKWYAAQYQPTQRMLYAVGVFVKTVGTPTSDLVIIIKEDNGGNPTGSVLSTVSIPKEKIGSSLGWRYVQIGVELNVAKKYWIMLPSRGTAGNTFSWGKDAGATNTNANSSDGITWVVNSSSYGFNFRTYTNAALVMPYPTSVASNDKVFRELTLRKENIKTRQTMQQYLVAQGAILFKEKWIFINKIYAPDVMLLPLQVVRIRTGQASPQGSGLAIDGSFVISQITYIFTADDSGATGSMYFETEAIQFVNFP